MVREKAEVGIADRCSCQHGSPYQRISTLLTPIARSQQRNSEILMDHECMNATVTTDPIKPFSCMNQMSRAPDLRTNQQTPAQGSACSSVLYSIWSTTPTHIPLPGVVINRTMYVRVYCIIIHGKEIHLSGQHQDAQLRNHFPGAT